MVLGIAFRLFLFTSWDQVLVRMNSPPEQLPPYRSALCRVGTGSLQRPDFGSGVRRLPRPFAVGHCGSKPRPPLENITDLHDSREPGTSRPNRSR